MFFVPRFRPLGLGHVYRCSSSLRYRNAGLLKRYGGASERYVSSDVAPSISSGTASAAATEPAASTPASVPASAPSARASDSTPSPPRPSGNDANDKDAPFTPRTTFPSLPSLPRSYFLGHHKAGLEKMKGLLNTIDLVLECRDYRVPVTSRNPLFEEALEGKERVIVFTKRDLGGADGGVEERLRRWCLGRGKEKGKGVVGVLFTRGVDTSMTADKRAAAAGSGGSGRKSLDQVIRFLREHARGRWKLVGHRVLVVGMPNVGKSTLLNGLRGVGMRGGKTKVARTGAQPGVTRKVGTGVKVVPGEDDVDEFGNEEGEGKKRKANEGVGGGVYVLDTPGVFIPYVPSSTAMMKLALVGSVKDTIIPPVLLADYLLFHLNRVDPALYRDFSPPTNDVVRFLENVARKLGRIGKGGKVDVEASAIWVVQRWRRGELGRFVLDDVGEEALRREEEGEGGGVWGLGEGVVSLNQARRAERERRRERGRARARGKGMVV
ncbi:P-loop containing nucleoside triphosphate hydrolase protein [Westerdykella ornata]|uniref:P-loop containing nucleoside triphosphate hydrolase protein n=1 Tax=Westerdykella ornata TaxID=318751 RepID=A0A6A6JPY5_WESOR|nr:P-loop containing nucleoside triphosphate hydrolase protein [Westerdykella ornata]KAF2277019.1 P-loop containing nucleoside triphosphate hydrolase protein [Westerdykella ornata]